MSRHATTVINRSTVLGLLVLPLSTLNLRFVRSRPIAIRPMWDKARMWSNKLGVFGSASAFLIKCSFAVRMRLSFYEEVLYRVLRKQLKNRHGRFGHNNVKYKWGYVLCFCSNLTANTSLTISKSG